MPGLDGLRGLAIGLVLAAHLLPRHLSVCGDIGVDLFFVLSGFLITLLLIRERDRSGSVSLRAFYVRRILRIMPAYLVFLLTAFALSQWGMFESTPQNWLVPLTYTTGFIGVPPQLDHTWSLATEEHFYLVWPFVFVLLPRRAAFGAAIIGVLAGPFLRLLVREYLHAYASFNWSTPARLDGIAAGCCLAFIAWSSRVPQKLRTFGPMSDVLALALLAASLGSRLVLRVATGDPYHPLNHSVSTFAAAAGVWIYAHRQDGPVAWLLGCRPAVALGVLSYSLYLWQGPFLMTHASHWAGRWPANMALAAGLAALSYGLIERPFLRLRNRMARRAQVTPSR